LLPAKVGLGQVIWTGSANDNNWSSATNWSSGVVPANDGTATVQFAGSTRTTPNNGAAWSVAGITFNSGADAFSLGGSGLTVGSGGITNNSSSLQTIANAVTLGAAQTWFATSGNLNVAAVDNGGFTLTTEVGAANALDTTASVTVASGATVDLGGFNQNWPTLAGSGTVTFGTAQLAVGVGGGNSTFDGVFSGAGNVTKTGAGTFTLGGTHTYTGAMTVSQGTLVLGVTDSLAYTSALSIASGATVNLGASQILQRLSGAGAINVGTSILSVGSGGATSSFSGDISGQSGSVKKVGSGLLTVLGNITAPIAISDGTLVNSGSLQGAVSVQSPGLLSGNGTFAGLVTVNSGGTVSPGAGVGTVSFGGGLTINPGAVFNFQLGSTSNQLQITGGTLTGPGLGNQATLNFVAGNGFGPGTYTLMSYASAAVSGDFGAGSFAVGSGLNGYAVNLATNGSALELTVSAIPEPATTAGLAGLAALGLVFCKRRNRLAAPA
jgi:autotransporter-associated beta strand protein